MQYLLITELKHTSAQEMSRELCECRLCLEKLEFDDLSFYPCPCGYQVPFSFSNQCSVKIPVILDRFVGFVGTRYGLWETVCVFHVDGLGDSHCSVSIWRMEPGRPVQELLASRRQGLPLHHRRPTSSLWRRMTRSRCSGHVRSLSTRGACRPVHRVVSALPFWLSRCTGLKPWTSTASKSLSQYFFSICLTYASFHRSFWTCVAKIAVPTSRSIFSPDSPSPCSVMSAMASKSL